MKADMYIIDANGLHRVRHATVNYEITDCDESVPLECYLHHKNSSKRFRLGPLSN